MDNDIKQAREKAGLTQLQMCELMQIPKGTLANQEQGIRIPPAYVKRFILKELEEIANSK